MDGWGYEEVGEVVEVGDEVDGLRPGDRVWGTWGHRTGTVQPAERAAARLLGRDVDPRIGIFSQIAAIGLNVVLDADIHVGETVAVFGLGVPGQIVAQLARLNGAAVIGVDGISARRRARHRARRRRRPRRRRGRGGRADPRADVGPRRGRLPGGDRQLPGPARGDPVGGVQLAGLRGRLHAGRRRAACGWARSSTTTGVRIVASQISGTPVALGPRWDQPRLVRTFMELVRRGEVDVGARWSPTSSTPRTSRRSSNGSTAVTPTSCRQCSASPRPRKVSP